jgi:ribosomal protein S18 acetylase RimI-like enzyme
MRRKEAASDTNSLEVKPVTVRTMNEDDLEAVVAIDAAASGRRRPRYFRLMIERALKEAGLQVSLSAELEGQVVGFLIASLYYGEYGVVEPSASIDSIGVHPRFRGRHVGRALVRQLRLNLGALHIEILRTEVSWADFDLMAFLKAEGFTPSARLCLECPLDPTAPRE